MKKLHQVSKPRYSRIFRFPVLFCLLLEQGATLALLTPLKVAAANHSQPGPNQSSPH